MIILLIIREISLVMKKYSWSSSGDFFVLSPFLHISSSDYLKHFGRSLQSSWYRELTVNANHLLWPYTKIFLKRRRGLEIVSLLYFLHDCWIKMFLILCSMNWPNFIAFTSWDIGHYIYYNYLFTRLWRRNFLN